MKVYKFCSYILYM